MLLRRHFVALAGGSLFAQTRRLTDISVLPNFCSHEHWGSIDSIGTIPGGYRADYQQGARPTRPTGLFDLLIEPYLRGLMLGTGVDRNRIARASGWRWFTALRETLQPFQLSGIYQCTRRGIRALYGIDIDDLNEKSLAQLESLIDANYRDPFRWYQKAMPQAHFSELVRPVHPEFYRPRESTESAQAERKFTHTVMRIDPFLDLQTGPPERRKSMIERSGIEPGDATTWRKFVSSWFDAASSNGAVGIKQLQAYRRSLDFQIWPDTEIRWNDSQPEEKRKLQDWIVHECCQQAHDRGWPHQIHIGTNNLPDSSPLPLQPLARRYGKMKMVLIHCWPYVAESGAMARQISNVYLDTCWQPVLNPEYFKQAMTQWWNYVPRHKITCGHDSTTVEMAVGSSLFTREILSALARDQMMQYSGEAPAIMDAVRAVLHNNAVAIYGIGKPSGSKTL